MDLYFGSILINHDAWPYGTWYDITHGREIVGQGLAKGMQKPKTKYLA